LGDRLQNGSPYATGPLSVLSVCLSVCLYNVGVLWPNGWIDQDTPWYGGRPRPRPHCDRWRSSSPTERGTAASPTFTAHVYCAQKAGWIRITWHGGRPQPRRHCVRWRPSSPHGKGHSSHPSTSRHTLLWHGRRSQQLLSSYQL